MYYIRPFKRLFTRKLTKLLYKLTLILWSGYDFPSIRPVPCTSKVTGEVGTCMYNWSCRHVVKGTHIGTCVDRFLVGSCCRIPTLNPDRATTAQWLENLSQQVTKRPHFETLATVIEILTLANKHFVRKPVSPVYHKVTVGNFSPAPTKPTFVRNETYYFTPKPTFVKNETYYFTPKPSHVSGTHLVEVTPAKFHPPAYLTTPSSISSAISGSAGIPSFVKRPTFSPPQSSSSVVTTPPESNSSSQSTNNADELVSIAEDSRRTRPTWTSVTPSVLPVLEKNNSLLDDRDISKICGRSLLSPMGRIVGGRRSQFLRWPWMISLRRLEDTTFRHKCGAALLNRLWAITAAHCVNGKSANEIILRLGEYNFHQENETLPHIEQRVQFIVIHPKFDSLSYENDLALLHLLEPVKFGPNVLPICLPEENDDAAGQTAVVTGWGRLAEEGELPGLLHEVHMPILTNAQCEEMYSDAGYMESIPDVFVCAGVSHGGLDACEGDSGGPMVVRGRSGSWVLVGLISWGMGCAAPNQPGVYTRITKYIDWINDVGFT